MRRQYSLPNCLLVLDGLTDDFAPPADGRPVLSIVTNAECRFVGVPKILQGGRVFLENLANAVSSYAQECLSGIRHPIDPETKPDHVYLEKAEDHLHRLVWYPSPDLNEPENPVKIEITTVQLFDLVEAIDQFFADNRTLPDLTLKIQPVSRRYRPVEESAAGRAVPFLAGVGSLALCALLFSLIPVPRIEKPVDKPVAAPTPAPTLPNRAP
ncbi:DUF4335 domain-containing protein [Pannus brasiliensis]|uniref:DUF4335 domain-containing protein n=1 Tax=Pannus brasiliensis TaxID=1579216 RepID=UPI003BEEF944